MTIAAVRTGRWLPWLTQVNVLDRWRADVAAVQVHALGVAKLAVLRTACVSPLAASLLTNGLCSGTLQVAVFADALDWLLFRNRSELALLSWKMHHALWRINLMAGSC